MDKLDFLTSPVGEEPPATTAAEPAPETPPPAEPHASPEPADAEPVQAAPAPAPAATPVAEPAPQAQPAPGYVPIQAMLETRDKLKAAEAKLAALQPAQEPELPDAVMDPQGFAAFQAAQTQQAVLGVKLDISEDMARQRHGDGAVDQARDWALQRFQESPAFRDQTLGHRNPYEFIVQQFKAQTALSKLGDPSEVDAFLAWKAAQASVASPATAAALAPASPQASPPTPSLAAAPSAGGVAHVPTGPGQAYDALFQKG